MFKKVKSLSSRQSRLFQKILISCSYSIGQNYNILKILATMSGQQRKRFGFGLAKTVKFGNLSMVSHDQICLA